MKERNKGAICGTCPYFEMDKYKEPYHDGWCKKDCVVMQNKGLKCDVGDWCGDHPDFWRESGKT